jgi:plastocyanin
MKQIYTVSVLMIFLFTIGCATQQIRPAQPAAQAPSASVGELGIKRNVEISGFEFNPSTITIPKGTTLIWTNMDSVPHTIFSDSGDEIHSDSLIKGETYAHTFNDSGTYKYHCGVHPSMKGVVVVE